MPPDHRKVVGEQVHTLAHHVTNLLDCNHCYGSLSRPHPTAVQLPTAIPPTAAELPTSVVPTAVQLLTPIPTVAQLPTPEQGSPLIVIWEMHNLPLLNSPSPTGMSMAKVIEEIGWGVVAFLVALAVPCAFINRAMTASIHATQMVLLLLPKQVALPWRTPWLMMATHVRR